MLTFTPPIVKLSLLILIPKLTSPSCLLICFVTTPDAIHGGGADGSSSRLPRSLAPCTVDGGIPSDICGGLLIDPDAVGVSASASSSTSAKGLNKIGKDDFSVRSSFSLTPGSDCSRFKPFGPALCIPIGDCSGEPATSETLHMI